MVKKMVKGFCILDFLDILIILEISKMEKRKDKEKNLIIGEI